MRLHFRPSLPLSPPAAAWRPAPSTSSTRHLLGAGTLDGTGTATLASPVLSVGSHSITAVYNGDANFTGNTSPVDTTTVNKATSAVLVTAADASVFGQSITLTATVSTTDVGAANAAALTGTVNFFNGATLLGTGTIASGVATFTTSSLSVGSHSITAVYGGDSNYTGNTSPVATQTTSKANTVIVTTENPNPIVLGQSTTLTATVTAVAAGGNSGRNHQLPGRRHAPRQRHAQRIGGRHFIHLRAGPWFSFHHHHLPGKRELPCQRRLDDNRNRHHGQHRDDGQLQRAHRVRAVGNLVGDREPPSPPAAASRPAPSSSTKA